MSRSLYIASFLLLVNFIIVSSSSLPLYDVRQLAQARLLLTEDDMLSNKKTEFLNEDRETRFIGDLVVGQRRADETIFRRTVEVANPTDGVYSTAITLSVTNGIIHYMSVLNEPGSYAVACDEPYSLGTSKSGFNVRVLPNSKSILTMVVAAH